MGPNIARLVQVQRSGRAGHRIKGIRVPDFSITGRTFKSLTICTNWFAPELKSGSAISG